MEKKELIKEIEELLVQRVDIDDIGLIVDIGLDELRKIQLEALLKVIRQVVK